MRTRDGIFLLLGNKKVLAVFAFTAQGSVQARVHWPVHGLGGLFTAVQSAWFPSAVVGLVHRLPVSL